MTDKETLCKFCGRDDFKSKAGLGVHQKKYCKFNPDGAGYIPPEDPALEAPPEEEEEIPPEVEEIEEESEEIAEEPPAPDPAPAPAPAPKPKAPAPKPKAPAPEPEPEEEEEKKDNTNVIVFAIIGICIAIAVIVGVWYYFNRKKAPCSPCDKAKTQRQPPRQEYDDHDGGTPE